MKQKVNNKTTWIGFSFDIINELADRMNFRYIQLSENFSPGLQSVFLLVTNIFFRYEVAEAPDGQFGAETESGSGNWSGLMGMLMRDVSILFCSSCPIFILSYPNSSSTFRVTHRRSFL